MYKEPLYRRYYVSSACSTACVYMLVILALMIFLPLFLAYNSTGNIQQLTLPVQFQFNHSALPLTDIDKTLYMQYISLNTHTHNFCSFFPFQNLFLFLWLFISFCHLYQIFGWRTARCTSSLTSNTPTKLSSNSMEKGMLLFTR